MYKVSPGQVPQPTLGLPLSLIFNWRVARVQMVEAELRPGSANVKRARSANANANRSSAAFRPPAQLGPAIELASPNLGAIVRPLWLNLMRPTMQGWNLT